MASAMEGVAEEMMIEVQGSVYPLNMDTLSKLATDHLKLPAEELKDKSRLAIVKIVCNYMEEKVSKMSSEESVNFLMDMKSAISGDPPALEGDAKKAMELSNAKKELIQMEESFKALMLEKEKEIEKAMQKISALGGDAAKKGESKKVAPKTGPQINLTNSVLRRDFRIVGQVGEIGQKDKLSYVSLIRQIEAGIDKGYTEKEVIQAVINSISPGLSIRSYFEGSHDSLSLARVRKILRSHFQEGNATELYQQLLIMSQDPKEDALSYLIRCMDTRQKILFACKEEDENDLKYSPDLVQGLFKRSLETGLINDTIRMRIRPYIQDSTIPDEDLIYQMQQAVSAEAERKKKLGINSKKSVNEVSVTQKQEKTTDTRATEKSNRVLAAVEAMRGEVAALRSELQQVKDSQHDMKNKQPARSTYNKGRRSKPGMSSSQRPSCEPCKASGKEESCDHCSICGSGEHYYRGCKYQLQGNAQRLPSRGGR